MINAEKWKKEILDITEGGYYFAVSKDRQNIARSCDGLKCKNCIFDEEDDHDCGCNFSRMKWMLSEYKEPIKVTRLEHEILKWAKKEGYKYIERDEDGELYIFQSEPKKLDIEWDCCDVYIELPLFKKLFQFIQWADEKTTSIKDVLNNCEVIDGESE